MQHASHHRRRLHSPGFTLVELLIVIVMVAILAAIALPSFLESVRKGRRADAVSRLGQVQQVQERYRAGNPAYAGEIGALPLPEITADGYYELAVSVEAGASAALGYTATATAMAERAQSSDDKCQVLILEVGPGGILYRSKNSAGAVDASVHNPCWNR